MKSSVSELGLIYELPLHNVTLTIPKGPGPPVVETNFPIFTLGLLS